MVEKERDVGASAHADQALVASDGAPSGLHPSGFDPLREIDIHDEDEGFYDDSGRWWPKGAEWCDRCQGMGTEECLCCGDFCCCGWGEKECGRCGGDGYFVPTAAYKAAQLENARFWRELHESLRDSDAMLARRPEGAEPRSGGSAGRQASPERI